MGRHPSTKPSEFLRETLRPWYLRQVYFRLFPTRKPPEWDAAWQFPDFSPPNSSAAPRPLAIHFPMNDWHGRVQRTHHLVEGLSRHGFRNLYVNPHLGREFPRRPSRGDAVRLTQLAEESFELHVHLPREPVFHHRLLRPDESQTVADAVLKAARALTGPDAAPLRAVSVVSFPVWTAAAALLRTTTGAPVVYDCHDYLPGFPGMAPAILAEESVLFQTSDAVVCSAEALVERAAAATAPHGTPITLIRNAAAPQFLAVTREASVHPVTVGYAGALESWFDAATVRAAALAHPEWRFRILGRVDHPSISRELAPLPNLHLAGEVPFSRLPAEFARFSAGIIPFLPSPLIRATDPVKAYEYLAAGLPVIAADLPELARLGSLAACYRTPEEFIRMLERAIASDGPALWAARKRWAAGESWEHRSALFAGLLNRLLHSWPTA